MGARIDACCFNCMTMSWQVSNRRFLQNLWSQKGLDWNQAIIPVMIDSLVHIRLHWHPAEDHAHLCRDPAEKSLTP